MSYNDDEELEINNVGEDDDFDFEGDLDEETFTNDELLGDDDVDDDVDDLADLDGSEY